MRPASSGSSEPCPLYDHPETLASSMAYDDELVTRIRMVLDGEPGISEKRMFGGLAFLADGRLAVAASSRGGLMVRVDPAETDTLVAQPHVERFVMKGREMDGWLRVAPQILDTPETLEDWVTRGLTFARALPAT